MFQASRRFMLNQALQIEATANARAAIDVIERDVRLGGACLPITGDFMSLDGTNNNNEDHIWTRTGMVRPDMSCVRTATSTSTPASGSTISVDNASGFASGMRAYIRNASGAGEYFNVTSVNTSTNTIGRDRSFSTSYATGSGVYAIDDRHFYIDHWAAPWGDTPRLMLQVGGMTAQPFAVGIEKLDFRYQLKRNCPPCDIVNLPASEDEWRLVQEVLLSVTARSDKKQQDGTYYRRSFDVGIKPRNLIPQ
jgi:hypothetical protein